MIGKHEFAEWTRRVQAIIDNIIIPWEIHLLEDKIFKDTNGNGRLYLQIQFDDIDNVTGEEGYRAYCRKFYLSPHMTTQEVVRTAWKAYEAAVIHEASEKFKFLGQMIYGPHISVGALASIANERDVRIGDVEPTKPKMTQAVFAWAEAGGTNG